MATKIAVIIAGVWTHVYDADPARRWEPKRRRLRLRILSIAGGITRRTRLKLAARAPVADTIITGPRRLDALPTPT
ncbi:hypothetical protein [Rhodococcus marinonascens]|uniref:hypothetical protein n=1 Tax=Rhodococcus marinonascens TaxID=38311 RepID=UPI0009327CC3|nr:hypothetical protein [Rhodococcus marinonascens]